MGMYEINPFKEDTIEAGEKLLKLLIDEKRREWSSRLRYETK